jgi:hypothetical protein
MISVELGAARWPRARRFPRAMHSFVRKHQQYALVGGRGRKSLYGFVTPTVADLYFAGKMADGDLVRSPPIPA